MRLRHDAHFDFESIDGKAEHAKVSENGWLLQDRFMVYRRIVGRSGYPGLIGFSRTRENTIHLHPSLRFTSSYRVFEHTLNSWKLQADPEVLS